MLKFHKSLLFITVLACFIAGIAFKSINRKDVNKGLKSYYTSYFPVGVAVGARNLSGQSAEFIVKNFNSITPENAMKMGPIHPEENRYFWAEADSIVSFAQHHNLKVRGHNLCWHEQTPNWMFKNADGSEVSKEVLLRRLKDHINTVVKRYKGKIYVWDVVNEAIDDDSTKYLRNSQWYKICGEDFIIKAFEYAHEADPEAKLFYNDYNTERPEKTERVYRLVKSLVDKKVPIHGVGLQGHWSIFEPSEQELRNTINKFSSLGLEVQITELDMSVYRWEKERRPKRPDESDEYTAELQQKQAEQYQKVFQIFRDNKDKVTSVTFWNISDRYTWLDNYPVPGRKNYPLLFDTNFQPKQAYWSVVNFK
ncbi:endo-1,4-beta-xylanase [Pedobacter aquae]|uniref:Beta-xylanase n=1 Tax=Pedobacter aquae TaxID=2605747 RepID=A0A5C0VHE0_9SPHI|nr:endo-1,4-beta-xylanase [Pedobacter aquae]QEK50424.1 endo-1,4-beta-xylanase [Pedobacter aquae]